jgi:hypothetical protein
MRAGSAGFRVSPILPARLVIGMHIKTCGGLECRVQSQRYLPQAISDQIRATTGQPVFDLEGMRHVESIKPDLPRVPQLVPIDTRPGPRMRFELRSNGVCGNGVSFLSGLGGH